MSESGRRVAGDAALVFVSRATAAVALLALTPFVIAELGKPAYGVWIFVSAATGLAGLVDVGIAPAVSRVVAAAAARRDATAIRSHVSTALLVALAIDVLVLAVGWTLAPALAALLDVHASLRDDACSALRLAFAAFALTTLAGIWEGVLIGRRRFHALLLVRLGSLAAFVIGVVTALRGGHGVVGLAVAQVVAVGISLAIGAVAARSAIRPRHGGGPSRASLRELLRFGLPQQSSRIAYAGAMHYERLLVGVVCGAAVAAEYGAASVVVAALASLLAQTTVVLVPLMTQMRVARPQALDDAFVRASRSVAVVVGGIMGVVAATATPLVAAWLGPGFELTARSIQILVAGFALWVVVHPGFALVQALGRPGLEARAAGAVVLANAAGTTALVGLFGAHGIAFGTAAALALGALAFRRAASAQLPRSSGGRRGSPFAPIPLAAALAAGIAVLDRVLIPVATLDRPVALAVAGAEALLFGIAYLAVLQRIGALELPAGRALLRPPWPLAAGVSDVEAG